MVKIKRLSSIKDGLHTALIIDGKFCYLLGKENTKGRYIVHKRRKYYEDQMPLGEEVVL